MTVSFAGCLTSTKMPVAIIAATVDVPATSQRLNRAFFALGHNGRFVRRRIRQDLRARRASARLRSHRQAGASQFERWDVPALGIVMTTGSPGPAMR